MKELIERLREPAIADLPSSPSEAFSLGWRMGVLERMMWQPISTAPKDKTVVLVAKAGGQLPILAKQTGSGVWVNVFSTKPDHRILEGDDVPTHWMHLPPAPE